MAQKISIIDLNGNKTGDIDAPFFHETVRDDLILKIFYILETTHRHPYGPYKLAGRDVAATGKQRHRRRKYKTLYGYGISRVPRKVMSRRGERFYWTAAFAPGTRKGRQAHPPIPREIVKRINKKEKIKAFTSALAATASINSIKKRYENYKNEIKNIEMPIILNKIEGNNKQVYDSIEKLLQKYLGKLSLRLTVIEKKVRAGKGKVRGRKYKKTTGLLLVVSSKEKTNLDNYGIETVKAGKVSIFNLAPGGVPGRVTIYTSQAVEELKNRIEHKNTNKNAEKKIEIKK